MVAAETPPSCYPQAQGRAPCGRQRSQRGICVQAAACWGDSHILCTHAAHEEVDLPDWDQRVHDHPIIATLREIDEELAELGQPAGAERNESLQRVRRVVARISSLITDADSELLSPDLLDATNTHLPDVRDELRSFRTSGEARWLDSVNAIVDTLIGVVGWPLAYAATDAAGLRDAASNYRRSVGQLIRGVEEEVKAARARVAELEQAIEATKATIAESVTAGKTDVEASATAAEQRLAAVTAAVEAERARLDTLTAEYQRQFAANEAARTSKSDDAIAEEAEKHEQARAAAQADFEKTTNQLKANAEEVLVDIDAQREQALKVVNATGAIAYSGSYGAYAAQQRLMGDLWALMTVLTLIALIGFGIWQVLELTGTVDSLQLILRLIVTVPAFALVAFAAQQSGKHRENERRARRLELELAAIDPYLSLLDEEKRKEIKEQVAARMFAQPDVPRVDAGLSPLAEKLIEVLKEYAKK